MLSWFQFCSNDLKKRQSYHLLWQFVVSSFNSILIENKLCRHTEIGSIIKSSLLKTLLVFDGNICKFLWSVSVLDPSQVCLLACNTQGWNWLACVNINYRVNHHVKSGDPEILGLENDVKSQGFIGIFIHVVPLQAKK